MPPRLNLSDAERVKHDMEGNRRRQAEHRARRNGTRNVTQPHKKERRNVTPGQDARVGAGLADVPPKISKEIEKIGVVLAPFAGRGYVHDPEFWACLHAEYPTVPLLVTAYRMAGWLKEPKKKNQTAQCSEKFIGNWWESTASGKYAPRPVSTNGASNGVYHAPATRQRTPDPEGLPVLEAELQRVALPPRRGGTLKEKLAALRGGKR